MAPFDIPWWQEQLEKLRQERRPNPMPLQLEIPRPTSAPPLDEPPRNIPFPGGSEEDGVIILDM